MLLCATACGTTSARGDALSGARILDVRAATAAASAATATGGANATLSLDALAQRLASADYVLLGEVHDNAEHHRGQLDVLRKLVAAGRRPALAMEQFDREYQPAIDAVLARPGATADSVADAGHFNRNGWDWPAYRPLVALAIADKLPIVAINLSRDRTRDVARQGFAALGPNAASDLALDGNWSPEQQAVQSREIDEGHCGKLPASAMPRMIDIQRARDATMADALVRVAPGGAVVIAGNGHVRNDVGVPVYLSRRAKDKRVVALGFIESDTPSDVTARGLPFDYAWPTKPAVRDDPCAGFEMPQRR